MLNVRTSGWCRVEGCEISNLDREYGVLHNIPNNEQHIYYGHPEIQIENPYSTTHSVVYCVKPIDTAFGYPEINDIDDNWNQFVSNIQTWMDSHYVDTSDPDTGYYYVGKPFNVSKSSVIFYDDSSKSSTAGARYNYYSIVLVDEHAVANVINITAKYKGDAIPVGEELDTDQLEVVAQYDNGNEVKIDNHNGSTPYTLEPADKIVTQLGANVFEVYYIDPEGDVNKTTFTVQGIRNLQSIAGYWDGGLVAYGKEAQKKFFVVIGHYSDDTESTITDFEFPNGNIVTETNDGLIDIFYKGRTCQIQVTPFKVKLSRLIAYYNGPQVEVNHNFQKSYVQVKIYYSAENNVGNSYYETVDIENCEISDTLVSKEGVNTYDISYEGQLGVITTSFTVVGFVPDLKPTDMQVTYTGPGIYQGKTFDLERVICNIYYNDGTIKTVKDFVVSTNIIHNVGPNVITVTYNENSTTLTEEIIVNGLENDSTTNNNIFPTSLNNNYPRATILNNRYRGPAEGVKTNNYARMIIKNIQELYALFTDIEKQYNQIISDTAGDTSIKITALNNILFIQNQLDTILKDDHYTTGIYKSEDKSK
jgi:hypothetical protein